jgi:hypothetical protein
VKPDYSLTVQELYEQVGKKMIIEQKQPYLLSAVYHDQKIAEGLPSWIPDWSGPAPAIDTRVDAWAYKSPTGRPIRDEYGIDVPLVENNGREFLRIAGYAIAPISNVTPVLAAWDIVDRFSKEDSVVLKKELKEICDRFDDDAIQTAMIRDRKYPRALLASYPGPLFGYKDLYSFLTEPSLPVESHDFEGYESLVEKFRSALASLCDGRRLFTFDAVEWNSIESSHVKQRIGSAPAIVQEGDVVCMLFGGIYYYLLRDDVNGYVRLLGTCHIYGYGYEVNITQQYSRNVALHCRTGKPTHYFQIF